MTGPKYRQEVPGKGHYYHLPTGEQLPSVTNILNTCVNKHALPPSAAKETAAKAWELLPQMVAASRNPVRQTEITKQIKAAYREKWAASADLGIDTHHQVEADLLGKPWPDNPEVKPFAVQAARFFQDFGIDLERDIEATEATVVNRTWGYAGTGDLWLWLRTEAIPHRHLALLDYKTSKARPLAETYPERGLQLGALAFAEKLLLDDGTEVDPPGPIEAAYNLNLRSDAYALIPLPMVGTLQDAFDAFVRLIPTCQHLHSCYLVKPQPLKPPPLRVVA